MSVQQTMSRGVIAAIGHLNAKISQLRKDISNTGVVEAILLRVRPSVFLHNGLAQDIDPMSQALDAKLPQVDNYVTEKRYFVVQCKKVFLKDLNKVFLSEDAGALHKSIHFASQLCQELLIGELEAAERDFEVMFTANKVFTNT